jgi:hypothetical protein
MRKGLKKGKNEKQQKEKFCIVIAPVTGGR